jgi:hypothetical protein
MIEKSGTAAREIAAIADEIDDIVGLRRAA